MSILESNIAILNSIPEEMQETIHTYLITNFCKSNPFKPLSADEIYGELEEARESYGKGDYKDFDDAIEEISEKYGL